MRTFFFPHICSKHKVSRGKSCFCNSLLTFCREIKLFNNFDSCETLQWVGGINMYRVNLYVWTGTTDIFICSNYCIHVWRYDFMCTLSTFYLYLSACVCVSLFVCSPTAISSGGQHTRGPILAWPRTPTSQYYNNYYQSRKCQYMTFSEVKL